MVAVVFRALGVLVTVLFAILTAILTWPGFFRLEQVTPMAQIVAMRMPLAGVFAALALIFLLLMLARSMRAFAGAMLVIALVGAGANAATVVSRGTGGELPEPTAASVRVMTWNTAGEATDPSEIAKIAVGTGADVVALPETNADNGETVALQMREMGRPMWVHNVDYGEDSWDARRTTLLISPDLGDYAVIDSSSDGTSNTTVLPSIVAMPTTGDGPTIVAVHAVAPRPQYMREWSEDLRWIADQCAEASVIMAGDFNATQDHFTRLGVDDGELGLCRDAAADAGAGGLGTWPTDLPAIAGTPIDKIMYSHGWEVTGTVVLGSVDGSGSDHRPVIAQLEPAG